MNIDKVKWFLEFGEMSDVAGLIAPRYLLAINRRKDSLHSLIIDINQSAEYTRVIYKAAECPDHFEHRWGNEGHRFYKDLMWDFIMTVLQK